MTENYGYQKAMTRSRAGGSPYPLFGSFARKRGGRKRKPRR